MNVKEAGDLLDELARAWQSRNPGTSYAEALKIVMLHEVNADLLAAYSVRDVEMRQRQPRSAERRERGSHEMHGVSLLELGLKVDALTKAYMAERDVKDYAEAMIAVLARPENVELKEQYAFSRGRL